MASEKLVRQIRFVKFARYFGIFILLGLMAIFRFAGCIGHDETVVSSPVDQRDYPRYNNREFKVVKVLDGDTFDVAISDPKAKKVQAYTRVRLWGIDTPEIARRNGKPGMYFGDEAAEFARKLLAGKSVRLELVEGDTRGYYGRLLAYAWLADGSMYNERAIRDGFAYADHRFEHPLRRAFIDLEAEARGDLRGLWRGVEKDQLPRWYRTSRLKEFWLARDDGGVIPRVASGSGATTKSTADKKKSKRVRW